MEQVVFPQLALFASFWIAQYIYFFLKQSFMNLEVFFIFLVQA